MIDNPRHQEAYELLIRLARAGLWTDTAEESLAKVLRILGLTRADFERDVKATP
jgi:hypothetical protein